MKKSRKMPCLHRNYGIHLRQTWKSGYANRTQLMTSAAAMKNRNWRGTGIGGEICEECEVCPALMAGKRTGLSYSQLVHVHINARDGPRVTSASEMG